MFRSIEKFFDKNVRPTLASHGGNVEVVDIENDKLFIRLTGGCQGCSSSTVTIKDGIARLVRENYPQIDEVVDVTVHEEGENPYYK